MLNKTEEELRFYLSSLYGTEGAEATPHQIHAATAAVAMSRLADTWRASEEKQAGAKRAYYFSAEFLVGRAIYNNLLALGMTAEVGDALRGIGSDLGVLEDTEDAALGNGGLGRLAACFLDSAATCGIPLNGYGIRYRFGLFEQYFENGFQMEKCDDWTRFGDPWSVRREEESVDVVYKDRTIRAVPYDMPIIGYGGGTVNTLRLWQSEAKEEFDFGLFNDQKYDRAVADKNRAEDISRVLYPNDSSDAGKRLRIRQQYFFCSASLQDILRRHVARYGKQFRNLPDLYTIQLNDTHPTVSIAELVRILVDEHAIPFEEAFDIARHVFHYTNHTVMAEALESWDVSIYRGLLPRIYEIIRKIDILLRRELSARGEEARIPACSILSEGRIRMANLAVFGSGHVNGVAKLHTEILKTEVLSDWYAIAPEKFENMTNGVTQRRWLLLSNPVLSEWITEKLGTDGWVTDLSFLRGLAPLATDPRAQAEFIEIKRQNKRNLAAYIKRAEGIDVPSDFAYTVQIKRLHEYKRQLLNALSILDYYFEIRAGRLPDFPPTVFLFGAKAAPGYLRAKGIIKLIHEISRVVEQDPSVRERIRVVFVRNYNVSYAEKLVGAADLSEQISTAGTEASGTGNMKLMMNGAPTLGTFDGANVEIVEEAGADNQFIFGARVEEIEKIRPHYDPRAIADANPRLRRVLDALIDGTLDDGGTGIFAELRNSLLDGASWHSPDHYFLLLDFADYTETRLKALRKHRDNPSEFARKAISCIAYSGYFSSDRTIREYADRIWRVEKYN